MAVSSSKEPAWARTSFAAPAISPSKANCLALSIFIVLPSITDASNSAFIDDSISSNPSAMAVMSPNVIPNRAASTAAFANSLVPPPKYFAAFLAFCAISFITFPGATPAASARFAVNACVWNASFDDSPIDSNCCCTAAASPTAIPNAIDILATFVAVSAEKEVVFPKACSNAAIDPTISSVVAYIFAEDACAPFAAAFNSFALFAETPIFLDISRVCFSS